MPVLEQLVLCTTNYQKFNYLTTNRLIPDNKNCKYCFNAMVLEQTRDIKFGLIFRCKNKFCAHYRTTASVFKDTFFENMQVCPMNVLKAIFYLGHGTTSVDICRFTSLNKKNLINIKTKLIEKIKQYYIQNPVRLGGPGVIINVDETKLNHNVRSHRGRSPRVTRWALTIIDTSTSPSAGFAIPVADRSAATLLPIIANVVREGSIIYTDEWAAYNNLAVNNEYEHFRITHKYNFVCPVTGIHTQHVESFNNKLKLFIKSQRGCYDTKRIELCQYFTFINNFKDNIWFKILDLIKS